MLGLRKLDLFIFYHVYSFMVVLALSPLSSNCFLKPCLEWGGAGNHCLRLKEVPVTTPSICELQRWDLGFNPARSVFVLPFRLQIVIEATSVLIHGNAEV